MVVVAMVVGMVVYAETLLSICGVLTFVWRVVPSLYAICLYAVDLLSCEMRVLIDLSVCVLEI